MLSLLRNLRSAGNPDWRAAPPVLINLYGTSEALLFHVEDAIGSRLEAEGAGPVALPAFATDGSFHPRSSGMMFREARGRQKQVEILFARGARIVIVQDPPLAAAIRGVNAEIEDFPIEAALTDRKPGRLVLDILLRTADGAQRTLWQSILERDLTRIGLEPIVIAGRRHDLADTPGLATDKVLTEIGRAVARAIIDRPAQDLPGLTA